MGKIRKACDKDDKCCKAPRTKIPKRTSAIKEEITGMTIAEVHSSNITRNVLQTTIGERICFKPIRKCAEYITDLTINLAESFINETKPEIPPSFLKTEILGDKWPSTGQLNLFSAMEAVDEYIQSFNYSPSLNYCIDFIKQISESLYTSFVYEVIWSMPTKEEPVQLATASMYFNLKMYYAHRPDLPLEVTYSYEYSNMKFYPSDRVDFREDWIIEVINSKLEFMRKNDFKYTDRL